MIKPFKTKRQKVQDYPDPPFTITLYGESDISKYKLNDKVATVNNSRIGFGFDTVIGFDGDGDVMLKNCGWCNTRGGYSDKLFVYKKEFQEYLENIPHYVIIEVEKLVEKQKEFSICLASYDGKFDYKKMTKIITNDYVSKNWSKLNI